MTHYIAIGIAVFTLPIIFLLVSFTAFGLFESDPEHYGRTTWGIFNWGIQNSLNPYMKVDLVEGNFNIL